MEKKKDSAALHKDRCVRVRFTHKNTQKGKKLHAQPATLVCILSDIKNNLNVQGLKH